MENKIEELIKENMIHRFASELQNTEKEERKKEIREILYQLQRKNTNNPKDAREKLNEIYNDIDQETLKRKWGRLTIMQKKDRIKSFLIQTITDEEERDNMEKKIYQMLDDGKLKPKFVVYDHSAGKITEINIVPDKSKSATKTSKKPTPIELSNESENSDDSESEKSD